MKYYGVIDLDVGGPPGLITSAVWEEDDHDAAGDWRSQEEDDVSSTGGTARIVRLPRPR